MNTYSKISVIFFVAFCLLIAAPVFLFTTKAQAVKSDCVETLIAPNAPLDAPRPPECASAGGKGSGKWPFPDKAKTHFDRIDQGWDLQWTGDKGPVDVYAIADGTMQAGHNPGYGLFGPDYPKETLDTAILGYPGIYYGHVHILPEVIGKHVKAGDVIARTDPSGTNWPPNWIEPGFMATPGGGPAGTGAYPTKAGQQMHDWLNGL
jgi:hypothetical protein